MKHYDYIAIGAGSGGIASANRAALNGKACAMIEAGAVGGTCVKVGCVPKKVMWNAAHIVEAMRHLDSLLTQTLVEILRAEGPALHTEAVPKAVRKKRRRQPAPGTGRWRAPRHRLSGLGHRPYAALASLDDRPMKQICD